MNRTEAATEARKRWGDLGTISHGNEFPRLVWKIGEFDTTIGRGMTWEDAFASSERRVTRLQNKAARRQKKGGKDSNAALSYFEKEAVK